MQRAADMADHSVESPAAATGNISPLQCNDVPPQLTNSLLPAAQYASLADVAYITVV